jgi:hypothetical protein
MAHIYLDNKGRTVFVNKGQEIQDGVFEFTLTRDNDVLVVETTKQLVKTICQSFDSYIKSAKKQKVSS